MELAHRPFSRPTLTARLKQGFAVACATAPLDDRTSGCSISAVTSVEKIDALRALDARDVKTNFETNLQLVVLGPAESAGESGFRPSAAGLSLLRRRAASSTEAIRRAHHSR